MHVLVTGGAGFIGSHTVDVLLKEGHTVRILDILEKPTHLRGKPDYLPEEAEFMEGDVTNRRELEKALKDIEIIFHFAAYMDYLTDFSKFFHVNSAGTALLYELIVEKDLPIRKVIVASSQAVYGEGKYLCKEHGIFSPNIRGIEQLERGEWEITCPQCKSVATPQITDEEVVNPQNQYAISKYSQELIALNLGRRYHIPTTVLRYSIVQGARQSFYNVYSGVCRIFCLSMYFDHQPPIYEDGMQLRDYVNIEDVVKANLLVLDDPRADYQIFNVGGRKGYTVLEFARILAKTFGKKFNPEITGEFRFGDTRHIISSIDKLKALGWEPKNSVEKSVRDYYGWLNNRVVTEDILDYAEKKMKELKIVRRIIV
ncbi:MAG: SDR family NAD(P)-dependent oxidoreductase [Proteobacteria bacterium]|nr:SDR family NAD(P)-dependent oxidoreductase [Pseudomonadota bacterium]